MSGLALVARQLGAEVTGSDRSESSYIERLRAAGLEPSIGHDAEQVPEDAEVVISTAIDEDEPRARPGARAGPDRAPPRAAARRAVRQPPPARGRRYPRQDDDDGDAGPRAARGGSGPLLLPRGRTARRGTRRRRGQRGVGHGRVGGGRGRRERRKLPRAEARGRGGDQPGARPPLDLALTRRADRRLRPLLRPGEGAGAGRRGRAARRRSARPADPLRARPPAGVGAATRRGPAGERDRGHGAGRIALPPRRRGHGRRRGARRSGPPQRRQRDGGDRGAVAGRRRHGRRRARRSAGSAASRGGWS